MEVDHPHEFTRDPGPDMNVIYNVPRGQVDCASKPSPVFDLAFVDELVESAVHAYAIHPDAPEPSGQELTRAEICAKYPDATYIPRPRQLTAKEKARAASERLYKPGEIVVDTKGVEYACCNDGSLRLAGGHLRMKKKQRTKLRRMLKEKS